MRSGFWGLLVGIAMCFSVAAQTGVVLGPLSGYIEDVPTQSIRPIVGIPGGAYLGNPVWKNIERAWVSPAGARAVVRRAGGYAIVSGLNTPEPTEQNLPIEPVGLAVMRVAWSADGSAVAVAGGGQLQVVFWQEKERRWILDPPLSIPAEPITALAMGSKNGAVAFATSGDLAGCVYARWDRNENPQLLTQTGIVGALVYARDGETLYVSDRTASEITRMARSGHGMPVAVATADEPENYRDVVALALSADDRTLYSVHEQRRQVIIHNLEEGSERRVNLEGKPNEILGLPGSGLYIVAVREKSSDPVLIFDSGSDAFYFVPAGSVQ